MVILAFVPDPPRAPPPAAPPAAASAAPSAAPLAARSSDLAQLRLLLVDDEPPARARLRYLLAACPGTEVVGEAADGIEALTLAAQLTPDALLLDVQMPEAGGLEVAASLPEGGPAVVFVTAYDRFALQAFDAAAVDYLLKPVDPERLALALQRLRQRKAFLATSKVAATAALRQPVPQSLLVEELGRLQVLPLVRVAWLAAADNYVELHSSDGAQWLLRRTLTTLLADLGPAFVRIHRRYAVALAAVAGLRAQDKGDATVQLHNGLELACSRLHRAALLQALKGR